MTNPALPPHRNGDHIRGLIQDRTGPTILAVGVVASVTPVQGGNAWQVECRMFDLAGEPHMRTYRTDMRGRCDYLLRPWPFETNRHLRGEPFYPRDVHVPPVRSTEATECAAKTIVARYTAGNATWLIAEADRDNGDAFGWAEIVFGGGEWGGFNLRELENLTMPTPDGTLLVHRDHTFAPTRFDALLTR
jgi:hypothetical protein